MAQFPSMKTGHLLQILLREPLAYRIERQRGSHRRLVSNQGYPPLTLSYHENATVPPGAVRKIFTKDVGLSIQQAVDLIQGKRL